MRLYIIDDILSAFHFGRNRTVAHMVLWDDVHLSAKTLKKCLICLPVLPIGPLYIMCTDFCLRKVCPVWWWRSSPHNDHWFAMQKWSQLHRQLILLISTHIFAICRCVTLQCLSVWAMHWARLDLQLRNHNFGWKLRENMALLAVIGNYVWNRCTATFLRN